LCSRVRLAAKLSGNNNAELVWPTCFASLDALQGNGSAASEEDSMSLEELVDPWLAAAGSLKRVDIYEILLGSLMPDQQRQLDAEYPFKIDAPDGSKIPVRYSTTTDTPPTASAKLQQFFGTVESPAVGPINNRLPLSLSLLSPSGKEVLAQTVDLPFFWKETYPAVRAEMRGRYAKHPWPEDPLTAVATRGTKKQQQAATDDAKNTIGEGGNKSNVRPKKKKRGKNR
jgi:ATP-dependent helicase HrpB